MGVLASIGHSLINPSVVNKIHRPLGSVPKWPKTARQGFPFRALVNCNDANPMEYCWKFSEEFLMKKVTFLSLLSLISIVALAEEQVVTARLHPAVIGETPMFGTFWSEKNKIGFVQMGLVWSSFDPAVHGHGFKFSNETVTVISPILSEGCQVTSVKGSFNYVGGINGPHNPLAINLAGECADDVAEFEKDEIHMSFKNVPSLDGATVTPDLEVIVTH
jgi:hypothetical protein